jgi:hypothetical protein
VTPVGGVAAAASGTRLSATLAPPIAPRYRSCLRVTAVVSAGAHETPAQDEERASRPALAPRLLFVHCGRLGHLSGDARSLCVRQKRGPARRGTAPAGLAGGSRDRCGYWLSSNSSTKVSTSGVAGSTRCPPASQLRRSASHRRRRRTGSQCREAGHDSRRPCRDHQLAATPHDRDSPHSCGGSRSAPTKTHSGGVFRQVVGASSTPGAIDEPGLRTLDGEDPRLKHRNRKRSHHA